MKRHRWKWKVLENAGESFPQLSLLKCRRCNLQFKWRGNKRPRIGDVIYPVDCDYSIEIRDCLIVIIENIMDS